jgi:zinc transporter 2
MSSERDSPYALMQDKKKKVRFSDQFAKREEKETPDMNEEAKKKLLIVCCVCSCFMIIEFIGGLLANSLAIMTDAAHLLSDLAGFVISIFAIYISSFPKNKNYTYGYHRAEIVGALVSVFTIWVLTATLFMESISRIIENHHKVDGLVMLITSSVGLVFNLIMVYILHSKVVMFIN